MSWVLAATLTTSAALAQERLGAPPVDKYTDAQKKVVADIAASGPRKEIFDPLLPMMRSPELAYTAERFGEHVYYNSGLDKRVYELAVILLARQMTQQFEWRVHYTSALKAGVKQADVEAIAAGRRPRTLEPDESAVYDFVVELYKKNQVSDATYARVVDKIGEKGVVEIVGLLGYYTTIADMMNVDRTPLHAGTAPLLKPLAKPLP
jgi:4-carboxymuconolactone decarboxylase